MPPRKTISTLQELTFAASCRLIHSSCKKIEDEFPTPTDMDNDTSGCKRSVQAMQTHLRRFIPPALWESLFEAVMKLQNETRVLDERIIYSTFLYENVNIKKMKIGYKFDNTDVLRVTNNILFELWLVKHLSFFSNLVEVDLSDVNNATMIPALCRVCPNLESISFPRHVPEEIVYTVIKSCPKLKNVILNRDSRYLDDVADITICLLPELEFVDCVVSCNILRSVFNSIINTRTLKIKKLIHWGSAIYRALGMCPDLEDLSLIFKKTSCEELFQDLAASERQLKRLSLTGAGIRLQNYQHFFTSKGIFLTDLEIYININYNPYEILREIGMKCVHLIKLTVWSDYEFADVTTACQTTFPALEYLRIVDFSERHIGYYLAKMCIVDAPMLKSFSLDLLEDIYSNADRHNHLLYQQVFSERSVEQLRDVRLSCGYEISLFLAECIYGSCTEMSTLTIGILSPGAKVFFEQICEEAKKKNLDFKCIDAVPLERYDIR